MADQRCTSTLELSRNLEQYICSTQIYLDGNKNGIINGLSDMVEKWTVEIGKKQKRQDTHQGYGAHVRPFGGYGVGIITKGGDLDLVAIVPEFVPRTEFFTSFVGELKKNRDVKKIRVVAEAYVPILQFCYMLTEIDLCICVTTEDKQIHHCFDVSDDTVLDGLDELSLRSLSGVRETAAISSLIPDNAIFRSTLKAVKLWAKRRGIHRYPLGFPGGIGWTILVAKICQKFDGQDVFTLLKHFFKTFLEWKWPNPVLLRPLQNNKMNLPQWNPDVCSADGRHTMPIITPAYPEHNATFTASSSNLQILQSELARGSEIVDAIAEGSATWDKLFESAEIQTKYKHFLVVSAHAATEEELNDWGGLVESRIRLITTNLEKQAAVALVHPATTSKYSTSKSGSHDVHTRRWLLGLELISTPGTHLSLAPEIGVFVETVEKLAIERHIFKRKMTIDVQHVKRKQVGDLFK